ncbi:MAG TPA: Rieske 2Fe-2S domain-containing protein, partial [Puia sp.]|nr:Rieske 2Fe-2S domain-containing protein [Puia sp.]
DNSVQLPVSAFAQSNVQFIRPRGWSYDLVVQKKSNDQYECMLLQCTHQQNQIIPTGNGFVCNLHGSHFDKDGNVVKGPAEIALKKYKTEIEQDKLVIHLKA